MQEVLRDSHGEILGCCEFYAVNDKGEYDSKGIYCWINEVEISKSAEHKGLLGQFILIITSKYKQFKFGYFWRLRKYKSRPPHIYTREQWLRRIK